MLGRAGVPVEWGHGGVTKSNQGRAHDFTHEVPFAPENAVRALNALAGISSLTSVQRAAAVAVVWQSEEQVDALHTVRLLDRSKLGAYAKKIARGVML